MNTEKFSNHAECRKNLLDELNQAANRLSNTIDTINQPAKVVPINVHPDQLKYLRIVHILKPFITSRIALEQTARKIMEVAK